ncbi:hypothetical protein EON65_21345 [archaeon]|nr:MAG: hypothetical protein EON65_21345 [archaeon]
MPKIKGGVLVFFPAYHILENTIERWQFSGLYQHLVSAAGAVIVETRANTIKKAEGSGGSNGAFGTGYGGSSGSFGATSESGRPAKQLDDNNEEEQQEAVLSNLVKQFERTIASKGSCILLAVCRGKVAEGVDFSDNKGRVVIVTGIPFAPFMDPWVALKKAYLDRKTMVNALTPILVNNAAPGGPVTVANLENNLWASAAANAPAVKPNSGQEAGYQAGPKGTAIKHLTGQMWYNQSAARAVNQCLGRVIRHQNDWGAIFLLDDRYVHLCVLSCFIVGLCVFSVPTPIYITCIVFFPPLVGF